MRAGRVERHVAERDDRAREAAALGDERRRRAEIALRRDAARAGDEDAARRVHVHELELAHSHVPRADAEARGVQRERAGERAAERRVRPGAERAGAIVERDAAGAEARDAAAIFETANLRRVQREAACGLELAAAVDVERAVREQRERARVLQRTEHCAFEHESGRGRGHGGIELENDLPRVERDEVRREMRVRVNARARRRVERHAHAGDQRVGLDRERRRRVARVHARANRLRAVVARHAQQHAVAAARLCRVAEEERVRAAVGNFARLPDLGTGLESKCLVRGEDDLRAAQRRAGVVHGDVVRRYRHARAVRREVAEAADEQALRAEFTEPRGVEHDLVRRGRDLRSGDQDIRRRARDVDEPIVKGRLSVRADIAFEDERIARDEPEITRVCGQARNVHLEHLRALREEVVREIILVLAARADDVARRDFQPLIDRRELALRVEVVEAVAGREARSIRQCERADRRRAKRRDERRAGQQRIPRGEQRVGAGGQAIVRAEVNAVAHREPALHIARIAAAGKGAVRREVRLIPRQHRELLADLPPVLPRARRRGAYVVGNVAARIPIRALVTDDLRLLVWRAGLPAALEIPFEQVRAAAVALHPAVAEEIPAAAADVDRRAALERELHAGDADAFHRQLARRNVRARRVDPVRAVGAETIWNDGRAAGDGIDERNGRDAAGAQRDVLRDGHVLAREQIGGRGRGIFPADLDRAGRCAQHAALHYIRRVDRELSAGGERKLTLARADDRDRAGLRRAAELVVVCRDRELHAGRGINLPRAQQELPRDVERAVAANVAAVRDEARLSDGLQ